MSVREHPGPLLGKVCSRLDPFSDGCLYEALLEALLGKRFRRLFSGLGRGRLVLSESEYFQLCALPSAFVSFGPGKLRLQAPHWQVEGGKF